ncbi:MAG: hypothetical protein HC911_13240, partial [Chloroflexaceae bacterium]|nr:hypothetical protein [Chloroflexaceae bacterium]
MRNVHVGLVGMMIGVCLLFSMLAGGAIPSTTLQAAALAQTQAGTEIAFITVNEQGQATGIDSIKPDGTGRRTIWQYSGSGSAGDINAVRWSSDATELAFTSDIEAVASAFSADVFGIKPDGTGLRRITNPPSQASIVAGIQNGSLQTGSVRVTLRNDYSATDFVSFFALYIRGAADAEVIAVSNFPAFGSSIEVLVPNVADLGVGEPQSIIATWSSGGCNLGKFVSGGFVDVQPGQTVDATVSFTGAGCGQAANALDLSWRRDGQRIGFSLSSLPAQVDVATGALSDWFDPQGNLVNSAAFAPTDNRVLYEAVGSQSGIYLVPDGQTSGTLVLPSSSLSPETPVWLPTGNGFLFRDLGVLKLADLSGQQIQELARFEEGSIRSASVSPDGNAVAIAFQPTGSTASDIYVLDFTDLTNPTTRQLTTDGRSTRPDWSRVPPSTPPATPTPTDAASATPPH